MKQSSDQIKIASSTLRCSKIAYPTGLGYSDNIVIVHKILIDSPTKRYLSDIKSVLYNNPDFNSQA